jgi:trehalose-6-phosphate synthase
MFAAFCLLRNKRRMLAMVDRVTTHDIRWWTATFLDMVEAAAGMTVEAPAPAVHS